MTRASNPTPSGVQFIYNKKRKKNSLPTSIMIEALSIIKTLNVMIGAPSIMLNALNRMLHTPSIMIDAPSMMLNAPSIMTEPPSIMTCRSTE